MELLARLQLGIEGNLSFLARTEGSIIEQIFWRQRCLMDRALERGPRVTSVYILAGLTLLCYVAIVALLVRQYSRTRDIGLIWLTVAVVVWPFMSRMLQAGEKVFIDRVARHQPVELFPFSLVESGRLTTGSLVVLLTYTRQLIGVVLLLVAVLYLSKMKFGRIPEPSLNSN